MRVKRIRQVPYYKYVETHADNEYIPKGEERVHWRNTVVVEDFDDAEIRQLDDHPYNPGKRFQLRVPMTDPETGEDTDCDGDRALLRVMMVGAEISMHLGVSVKGFVSKEELAHEKAYRAGDIDACIESRNLDHEFVIEEWLQLGES